MKIAFLANHNVIHTVRWANSMALRGHEVTVYSLHRHLQDGLAPGVKKIQLPFPPNWGYYANMPYLRFCLRKFKPDILNAHYASGYGTLGRLSGFHPYVLSVWGSDVYDFPGQSPLKHKLLIKNLSSADLICSTSRAMAVQTRKVCPTLDEIAITPFGVDTVKFCPARREAGSTIIIGTVKKLEYKYGIDTLIRAFAHLRDTLRQRRSDQAERLRLLIVGGGSDDAALRRLAREADVDKVTSFRGVAPHDQIPAYLNEMDIYVALSRLDSESFGVAILEASACGLPVVVSDADGPAEVVLDNETGLIVPRENVSAAAAALERLVLDVDLREQLGRSGRIHVEAKYTWGHCVDIMENAFRQKAKGQRPLTCSTFDSPID
ncbi:MAG: glycosyltransferase family 4 protein [Desulforudis sp.]|jgi:glycosyltransferase involved in cell wall biosynthesis|nr:MAG: glycosyltransferase family 4 protein [Desulforudis sp.]